LGEIKDTNCYNKCLAHKYLWIDLCRVDGCECQGSTKRLFSYHNYIFDIPLEKIFNLTNNVNLIEMSKSFKIKSINTKNNNNNNFTNELNQISSINNISDIKGKLFLYYKLLFNQLKTDCPEKGSSCEINKTNRAFFLTNIPYNLSFSLMNPKKYGKIYSHWEILKAFILIPKILDLSILFDYSSKQKVFYEFFGAFLIKPSKSYSCFFRQNAANHNENHNWIHYDCGKVTTNNHEQNTNTYFNSWYELISFCLANGEYPIMIFYQIQQKYNENDKDITNEEIQILERYAKSADNLNSIVMYKFRPTEDIIKSEPSSVSNSVHLNNTPIQSQDLNNLKNISKVPSSIASSRNTSHHNSNSRIEVGEYNCIYCFCKNKMDVLICFKCGQNNEAVVEDILKKRLSNNNYINIANFNLNINTEDKVSFRTNENLAEKNNIDKNILDFAENHIIEDNPTIVQNRESRAERERESIKNSSLNKKHSESLQPHLQNPNSRSPFQVANNKKEKERNNNINTINHEEELKMKSKIIINFVIFIKYFYYLKFNKLDLNMPKQLSRSIISNNKQTHNINTKDIQYPNERSTPNNIPNKEYLNSPPNQMNRSNSKKNLNINYQNTNNLNSNNNPNFAPDNIRIKKMETITSSSYVSTPVFNKDKEKIKNNEKEKHRYIIKLIIF